MTVGLELFGFVSTKIGWSDVGQQVTKVCSALSILFALNVLRMHMHAPRGWDPGSAQLT